jgi:hypothetical protein
VFGVERCLRDRRAARVGGRLEHHQLFCHNSRLTDLKTGGKLQSIAYRR